MKYSAILGALVASSLVEALPLFKRCDNCDCNTPASTSSSNSTSANGTSSLIAASWIQGYKTNASSLGALTFSKYTHMTYGFAYVATF